MEIVYFLTSYHYNPAGNDPDPLCLVWIGQAGDHRKMESRLYSSYDLPRMLKLANRLAAERALTVQVLSADPVIDSIHEMNPVPG